MSSDGAAVAGVVAVIGGLTLLATIAEEQEKARKLALKAEAAKRVEDARLARLAEVDAFKHALAELVKVGGLYQEVKVPADVGLWWGQDVPSKVDCWCGRCRQNRPFKRSPSVESRVFGYLCLGCEQESFEAVLKFFETPQPHIQKIGQHPALADVLQHRKEEWNGVLPKKQMGELSRALGLRAHGIGIGSYVYLRRTVEWLIAEARKEAVLAGEIAEDAPRGRIGDEVKRLEGWLPPMLAKNPNIYGVLSKGVHELSEKECLDHFEVLYKCIATMLDQRRRNQEELLLAKQISGLKV